MKVVRRVRRYVKEAMEEAFILQRICSKMIGDDRVVRLFDHFAWREHYCLVLETLGMSLHDFQKKIDFKPIHIDHLEIIVRDLFAGLAFLHERCGIVHTDLKVENVLLEQEPRSPSEYGRTSGRKWDRVEFRVKLIDFGGATRIASPQELHDGTISTRQYRAPEVLLDTGWSFPADIWSAGCILMELLCGHLLFQTHEEHEHLALIERVVGEIPNSMKLHAQSDFFTSRGQVRFPSMHTSPKRLEFVQDSLTFHELIRRTTESLDPRPHEAQVLWFSRTVAECLRVDPSKRATAREISARNNFMR